MNTLLSAGMRFIAAVEITVGVVATLTPRWFYDNVPWWTWPRGSPST
jgi:hypothetical protein